MDTIVNVEVYAPKIISIDLEKLFEKILEEAPESIPNWTNLSNFDRADYMKGETWDNMDYYLNKIGISEEITCLIEDGDLDYISDQLDILIDKKLC